MLKIFPASTAYPAPAMFNIFFLVLFKSKAFLIPWEFSAMCYLLACCLISKSARICSCRFVIDPQLECDLHSSVCCCLSCLLLSRSVSLFCLWLILWNSSLFFTSNISSAFVTCAMALKLSHGSCLSSPDYFTRSCCQLSLPFGLGHCYVPVF